MTGLGLLGLLEIQERMGEKLLLLEQPVPEQKEVLSGTGRAHAHAVSPRAAASGGCSRASPVSGANHLSCWELPGGEVCADAPAALCWPDGQAVSPCTTQFGSPTCTSPSEMTFLQTVNSCVYP